MKKLLLKLSFIVFILLTAFSIIPVRLFAQETPSILITTTYQSKSDLDFLFLNSSVVLKYLEGGEIDKPIFIALVTPSQKELLHNYKFPLQTIDENTDISRYKLYFTYESNKSDLLKTVGDVFPLSLHHTLLRFPADASKIYANLQLPRFDRGPR
jgi:hypothetical protein